MNFCLSLPENVGAVLEKAQLGPVVAWIAALIALGSLIWTLAIRWRDRKEPDWFLDRFEATDYFKALDERFTHSSTLINVGDGDGFQVTLSGQNCTPQFAHRVVVSDKSRWKFGPDMHARVASGQQLDVVVAWDESCADEEKVIEVSWRYSPTKHKKTKVTKLNVVT